MSSEETDAKKIAPSLSEISDQDEFFDILPVPNRLASFSQLRLPPKDNNSSFASDSICEGKFPFLFPNKPD